MVVQRSHKWSCDVGDRNVDADRAEHCHAAGDGREETFMVLLLCPWDLGMACGAPGVPKSPSTGRGSGGGECGEAGSQKRGVRASPWHERPCTFEELCRSFQREC